MYQAFEMNYKNNQGYVKIYPNTTTEQVMGYNLGEVYGPYQITLSVSGWSNNVQTENLSEVRNTDYLICNQILTGTNENMVAQDEAYSMLTGVKSSNGSVQFTCSEVPGVDLTVQVSWVR